MKALITYNHIINLAFLNQGNKLILHINNKEKEIDMKINRYKYTNKGLNITIIEILELDNINDFIDIDIFINSRNYVDTDIISVFLKDNKNFELSYGKIAKKNNDNCICNIETNKEGIIILKENNKFIGIIKEYYNNNEIELLPMNVIINKINFIKGTYEIKKEKIGKVIHIIDYLVYDNNRNTEEKNEDKIKVIIQGKINLNMFSVIFNKEGIYIIYFVFDNLLTNMYSMFRCCYSLKELDFSSFNTEQVTNMSAMFRDSYSLQTLDLSPFNTNKVTDMSSMFHNCISLKKLNLSSFNTKQVTNMACMFQKCSSLEELDLSSFNTKKVIHMTSMFNNCSSLKELNLSSFYTKKVTHMNGMFKSINKSCKINCIDEKLMKEFKTETSCIII